MMDTNNRIDAAKLLPVMIGVALASALLAGLALIFVGKTAGDRARFRESFATLSALSQNIPLQAGAAVRGSAPAFDALADSRSRLEQTLKSSGGQGGLLGPDDRFGDQAGWTALLEQSQAVLDGRDAALKAQQAAANVRETTPQLLAALTAVVDGVGPARAENLNRHAERFEVRARAVEPPQLRANERWCLARCRTELPDPIAKHPRVPVLVRELRRDQFVQPRRRLGAAAPREHRLLGPFFTPQILGEDVDLGAPRALRDP